MGRPEERAPFADMANVRERLLVRGIKPRKKWGQNFLLRPDIGQRIVDAVPMSADDVVVEIGPGAGALTGLLAARARRVVAVEFDEGLADLLAEDFGEWSRVELVRGDIRDVSLDEVCARNGVERVVVVGNVPYSITTPILEWLIEWKARVGAVVLLVQREYAARLAAAAGTEDYGSLTVFARYHVRLEPLFTIPPGAFWPRPAVDSTLLRLRFRDEPPVVVPDEARFFQLVRAAFGQRRKTIANALLPVFGDDRARVEKVLRLARIAPARRGETLDLEEFAHVAQKDALLSGDADAEGTG